ncbi:MAG TPA: hypothetical protein PKL31_15065 [Fulvivirga sp.]|nr:hypothetical protein [Fulvivirga sp.]
MRLKIIISILFFISISAVHSQSEYKTIEGHIILIGEVNEQKILAESHKLSIILDYATKEISGNLDLKTLKTGVEYLDKQIQNIADKSRQIYFSGTIPIDDFITQPHLPISFNWPVILIVEGRKHEISLTGTLTHFNGGKAFACLLGASADLSSEMIGLKKIKPDLNDFIKVQFTQTILRNNDL